MLKAILAIALLAPLLAACFNDDNCISWYTDYSQGSPGYRPTYCTAWAD